MHVGFLEKNYHNSRTLEKSITQLFIGTWQLVNWQYLINGEISNFWENPSGILIYTSEMKMSAVLMDSNRKNFESNFLSKGTSEEKLAAVESYISYSGDFSINEQSVYHHVQFSLFPNWIGTDLVRQYEFSGSREELILSTSPVEAGNGKTIQNILSWKRIRKQI